LLPDSKPFRVFGVFGGLELFVLFVFFCPDFVQSNGQNGIVGPRTNWGKGEFNFSVHKPKKSAHLSNFLPLQNG
jgi:hypothetical protein